MARNLFKEILFKRRQKYLSRSYAHQTAESRQSEDTCEGKFSYSGERLSSSYLISGLVKAGNGLLFLPESSSRQTIGTEVMVETFSSKQYKWLSDTTPYKDRSGPGSFGDVPLIGSLSMDRDVPVMCVHEGGLKTHDLSSSCLHGSLIGVSQAASVDSRVFFEKYLAFISTEHLLFCFTAASYYHDQVAQSFVRCWVMIHKSKSCLLIAPTPPISTPQVETILESSGTRLSLKQLPKDCEPCSVSETEDLWETFTDEDGIRIAKIVNQAWEHQIDGSDTCSGFKVSIPTQIVKSMPSAPNDFVAPESVKESCIQVRMVNWDQVNLINSCIDWLLQGHSGTASFLGLVCKYCQDFRPCLVQLSAHQRCVLIRIPNRNILTSSPCPEKLGTVLSDSTMIKVGAEIHKDALALLHYLGLVTNRCIKISHLTTGQRRKKGVLAIFRDLFHWGWSEKKKIIASDWGSSWITLEQVKYAVLDAWSSRLVWARQMEMWKGEAPSFSLEKLPLQLLDYFGRSIFSFKELFRKDEDTSVEMTGAKLQFERGFLKLKQSHFRSRVLGLNSTVELRFKNGREPEKYLTLVRRGKKVVLDSEKGSESSVTYKKLQEMDIDVGSISKVFVDNSNNSDVQRKKLEDVLYFLLCTPAACPPHILVALGCSENDTSAMKGRPFDPDKACLDSLKIGLNESQMDAWKHMLSNTMSAVIGPPGTGKTTLIKSIAKAWDNLADTGETLLCAAHQNVAVRHMAESMMKDGISGVLLLISEDYYIDWHEEQYTQLKDSIVVSGPQTAAGMKTWAFRNKVAAPRVILCTLAVIGSQSFYASLMGTKVSFLIIDECSQAAEGHLISNLVCLPHLQMLSVLGDPSQLPPFGKPLQSVFDLVSNKCKVKFLHEQYRMPYCIAKFVSDEFYQGRLQTVMKNKQPKNCSPVAKPLLWIKVDGFARPAAAGKKSLCNPSEAMAIMRFCKEYMARAVEAGLTSEDPPPEDPTLPTATMPTATLPTGRLIVLTLYEGQRIMISKLLKENDLNSIPVYNVDSFQGQEADDVLISLVVGERGSAFAVDRNRACVLLSRAKRLMHIFGNLDSVKATKIANTAGVDNIWRSLARYCEKNDWVACEKDLEHVVLSLFQNDQDTNSGNI